MKHVKYPIPHLIASLIFQDIYCQTADNGLKSDANGPMAAELLRNILTSDPLYVKEYLHVHRDAHILVHREKTESAESNPNKDAMSSSLDNFPDVIKVGKHFFCR